MMNRVGRHSLVRTAVILSNHLITIIIVINILHLLHVYIDVVEDKNKLRL